MAESLSFKIEEARSDKVLQKMLELFGSVELLGNLEDKMNDGFKNEGIQRKKGYENLAEKMRKNVETESAKMERGFKDEENARQFSMK